MNSLINPDDWVIYIPGIDQELTAQSDSARLEHLEDSDGPLGAPPYEIKSGASLRCEFRRLKTLTSSQRMPLKTYPDPLHEYAVLLCFQLTAQVSKTLRGTQPSLQSVRYCSESQYDEVLLVIA